MEAISIKMLPLLSFSRGVLEILPFEHRQALLDWRTANHLSNILQRLGASEVVPSVSVLQDTEQVGRALSKVIGSNAQGNQLAAVKEVEERRNGSA